MSKTESRLYELLETILRAEDRPLTCIEIYDRQDVRELASNANRVSDYLGGLWRKGKVTRVPAVSKTANDGSRWSYSWRKRDESKAGPAEYMQLEYAPRNKRTTILDKPNILITSDEDVIVIELDKFSVTIKLKP